MLRINNPAILVSDELSIGHFQEGRSYRTVRQSGRDDWLLILTIAGRGRIGHVDGGETVVGPGEIVLIRPGVPHDYGTAAAVNEWELLWAHFLPRTHWLAWLSWPELSPGMMHLKLVGRRAHDRILERFEQAHRMSGGAVRGSELFAMNAIEEVLLWCRTLCDDPASRDSDPRFEAAQRYIRQHLAGYITLPILAAHCRLSVSRLSQLFREHAGTTAIRYIEDLRIARARLLLARTSQTVGRIAEEVGFDNPFYFTLRFKRATGLSPTEFRKQTESSPRALEPTSVPETPNPLGKKGE